MDQNQKEGLDLARKPPPKAPERGQIPQKLQKLSPKDLQHPTFEAAQHFDYNQTLYD